MVIGRKTGDSRRETTDLDSRTSSVFRLPSPASGFTLVGVVIGMAIIVILLAAVGPTVATIIERDREKELIFRGKQYARAVLAFQKRYGRFPNELEELSKLKPRSIRKLWKDPMCDCDDWQIIIAGSPEAVPMRQVPPPQGGSGPGGNRTPRPGQPTPAFGGDLTPTPPPFLGGGAGASVTPTPSSSFGPSTGKPVGPIVGVRSKVRRKSIFEWRSRGYTDEWRFIAGDADNENGPRFDPNILRGPHFTPSPGAR
jgi:type II secretory pathway pseudopilin PulG